MRSISWIFWLFACVSRIKRGAGKSWKMWPPKLLTGFGPIGDKGTRRSYLACNCWSTHQKCGATTAVILGECHSFPTHVSSLSNDRLNKQRLKSTWSISDKKCGGKCNNASSTPLCVARKLGRQASIVILPSQFEFIIGLSSKETVWLSLIIDVMRWRVDVSESFCRPFEPKLLKPIQSSWRKDRVETCRQLLQVTTWSTCTVLESSWGPCPFYLRFSVSETLMETSKESCSGGDTSTTMFARSSTRN